MADAAPVMSPEFQGCWERIFARSDELVFMIDGERRIVAMSEGFARRFELSDEVLGHACAAVAHEGGVVPEGCPFHELLLDGRQHAAEVGSELLGGDFLVRVTPLLESGEVAYALHSLVEIRWRRLEGELDDERQRYKLLVENSGEAILLTDPNGRILSANPEACRIFGRSEEDLKAATRAEVVDVTDPRLAPALLQRERTGGASTELRLLRADGTTFPGEVLTRVYTDHAGLTRSSMVIRDLTERERVEAALRESEKRYRGLFEHSMFAAAMHGIVTDEAGRPVDYVFLEANPAFETATGLRAAEIVGRRVTEVLPGIEETPFIEVYGKVALGGEAVTFEQFSAPLGRDYLTVPTPSGPDASPRCSRTSPSAGRPMRRAATAKAK